mmetsp:Transcript_8231/g.17071  ORF Transcript_8231/g.17071 Transcript_8231/m.17071 type:complete len:105 (-) Transcript_8231:558-872(-)
MMIYLHQLNRETQSLQRNYIVHNAMMLPTTIPRKSRIRSSNNQNPQNVCRGTRPEDHFSNSRNKSTLAFVLSSNSHAALIIPTKVDVATFLECRMGFFPRVKRR